MTTYFKRRVMMSPQAQQILNKNFIRNFKLPIAVDKDPYFTYFLNLLNPYFDTLRKYEIFKKVYQEFGESLFKHNSQKLNDTIQYLTAKDEYQDFVKMDMSRFNRKLNIKGKDLYVAGNENKRYISIDLVKANFQSFLFVMPEIFDGFKDFNSFAKSRDFNEVLLESKISRQVIFGGLSASRQQQVQKYMMEQIIFALFDRGVKESEIYSLSSDEVFFEDKGYNVNDLHSMASDLGYQVRVEMFDLVKPFEKAYFVKERVNGSCEFKMVPTAVMAEFIKKYEGKPLEDMDFYFYDENKRLSRFIEEGVF